MRRETDLDDRRGRAGGRRDGVVGDTLTDEAGDAPRDVERPVRNGADRQSNVADGQILGERNDRRGLHGGEVVGAAREFRERRAAALGQHRQLDVP